MRREVAWAAMRCDFVNFGTLQDRIALASILAGEPWEGMTRRAWTPTQLAFAELRDGVLCLKYAEPLARARKARQARARGGSERRPRLKHTLAESPKRARMTKRGDRATARPPDTPPASPRFLTGDGAAWPGWWMKRSGGASMRARFGASSLPKAARLCSLDLRRHGQGLRPKLRSLTATS